MIALQKYWHSNDGPQLPGDTVWVPRESWDGLKSLHHDLG